MITSLLRRRLSGYSNPHECLLKRATHSIPFRKLSVDIENLLKYALDFNLNISDSSNWFICRNVCYKRLLKLEKLQKDLKSLKEEIKIYFKSVRTKRMRVSNVDDDKKISSNKISAAKSLRFEKDESVSYTEILWHSKATHAGQGNGVSMPTTLPVCSEACASNIASAQLHPVTNAQISQVTNNAQISKADFFMNPSLNLNSTSTPIFKATDRSKESAVTVSIDYLSKIVNKTLKKDYESVRKALVYGPAQRVAKAVLKCQPLVKPIIESVLRLISGKVSCLCSRKSPLLMRTTGKDDIANFNFQSLCEKWQDRAPIFYSFLTTVGISNSYKDVKWLQVWL